MNRRRVHPGFTLIELVLVLMLLALLMAAAAPSLGGWSRGQKLDNTAERLLAASRWARSAAIARAVPHRLEIDPMNALYRVTCLEGETWVPVTGEHGRDALLPPGLEFELLRQDQAMVDAIDFHPNGRVSPATLTLTAEWGEVVTLEAAGAADTLRRVSPGNDL